MDCGTITIDDNFIRVGVDALFGLLTNEKVGNKFDHKRIHTKTESQRIFSTGSGVLRKLSWKSFSKRARVRVVVEVDRVDFGGGCLGSRKKKRGRRTLSMLASSTETMNRDLRRDINKS